MRWLVAIMIGCWIFMIPPNAGPDEPSHVIRSAAVLRGDAAGRYTEELHRWQSYKEFSVPAFVGKPDPGCYAFSPNLPASCLGQTEWIDDEVIVVSRGSDYPIWGHILPGLSSFGPAEASGYLARVFDAAIPVALIAMSLAMLRRRSRLSAAAVLMALTPMAWFMVAVVNPSSLSIGGGIALWAGLLELSGRGGRVIPDVARWLAALGWIALALPRRDGLVWAVLIVGIVALVDNVSITSMAQAMRRVPFACVAVSTALVFLWVSSDDTRFSSGLLVTPFVLVGFEVLRWLMWDWAGGRARLQYAVGSAALLAVGVASYVAMAARPSGFDPVTLTLIINQTGANITEAVGVLGWLDTPIPMVAIFGYFILLGVLFAVALLYDNSRGIWFAGLLVAVAVLSSWVLEMFQDNSSGTYWQGRYWLPLMTGVPLVLARLAIGDRLERRQADRVARVVAGGSLVLVNVAFAAAARRWGVGVSGSVLPWRWDTYAAPLAPFVLLALHIAASIGLYRWLMSNKQADDTPEIGAVSGSRELGRTSQAVQADC